MVFQVIIGRTDSAQVLGMEEAIIRLKLAADAGADVCFIEGVKTEELLRSTVAALAPKPVRTPHSTLRFAFVTQTLDIGSGERYFWRIDALFHDARGRTDGR